MGPLSLSLAHMSCSLAKRIQNYLKNLAALRKDLEFYEQKKSLIGNFQNLKMDSKWDDVFASTTRFVNGPSTSSQSIRPKPVYQEYNIEKIVRVKYYPGKKAVILHHKNDPPIKFTNDEFEDFLNFLDTINDGWCETNFYIGEYIHVSYWHEEESKGMTVTDMRTNKVMTWNENHLELVLAHKFNLYDMFIKME